MKTAYDVIRKPLISEKSMTGVANLVYTFEVAVDASKTEIKDAVEEIFKVKVEKVNTVRTLGKIKRQGKFSGRTPEITQAYVTLKKDSKPIKFFEGMAQ